MDFVTEEILRRLPAKSLMRFKCVSKLWSSNIASRYFTKHFVTVPCRPRPHLYLYLKDLRTQESEVLSSSASTPSSFVVDDDLTIPQMVGYNLQSLGGFMCYTSWSKPWIFNPATRQLVTLPDAIIPVNTVLSCYFGHDPVNDEYKVVCSTGLHFKPSQEIRSEHWVYVLKRGSSWKKVAPTPPEYRPHIPSTQGVCIDGVIYYLGSLRNQNYVLVSFHIRSEEFKTLQVPSKVRDLLPRWNFRNLSVIDYGGKITLLNLTNLRGKGMLDLWFVEHATNKEWPRKTLILQPSQFRLVNNFTYKGLPKEKKKFTYKVKCTIQNGKLFLIPQGFMSPFNVLCYDMQSDDMKQIEIRGVPDHWLSKDKADIDISLMFMDQGEITHLET